MDSEAEHKSKTTHHVIYFFTKYNMIKFKRNSSNKKIIDTAVTFKICNVQHEYII